MSGSEDVPQSVLAVAEEAYQQAIYMTTSDEPQNMVLMVARAIMAERERCADLLDDESYAMRDQRDEMIEHGTLGGRRLPETVKELALIERRALFEGYATMAAAIRKGTP